MNARVGGLLYRYAVDGTWQTDHAFPIAHDSEGNVNNCAFIPHADGDEPHTLLPLVVDTFEAVSVQGDFNSWEPIRVGGLGSGYCVVIPLRAGRAESKFTVGQCWTANARLPQSHVRGALSNVINNPSAAFCDGEPVSPAGSADLSSPPIHNYDFKRQLAKVQHGSVKLATRKSDGKEVVLKEVNETRLFRAESKTLRVLRNPHIIPRFDSFEDNGLGYLAFPYCPDGDLVKIVNNSSKLSEKTPVNIIVQLLTALQYAHELSVAHRDIKLDNVLRAKAAKSIWPTSASRRVRWRGLVTRSRGRGSMPRWSCCGGSLRALQHACRTASVPGKEGGGSGASDEG